MKKIFTMRKLLFVTVIFSGLIFCSCSKHDVKHTVQYFISGEGLMNVSCTDANGEMIYISNVNSAWKYAFNAPGDQRIIRLEIKSLDGSAVGGKILIDGYEAVLNSSTKETTVSLITQMP
ncbi:MAG TPA: hypothetical protein VF144_12465 [Chitinophagaceae bacterium]